MEKDECWEIFLTSGKVTDYLSYRQAMEDADRGVDGRTTDPKESGPDDMVKQHAGFY